ncbi:MAG: hypothetical protein BRC33_12235 [Cyanobacteria bacterium SW_9_44_58]|nr:MAG: hypothetical protein BRC33_12235 [Cyanobacteria bacterium SW_9_44_58]
MLSFGNFKQVCAILIDFGKFCGLRRQIPVSWLTIGIAETMFPFTPHTTLRPNGVRAAFFLPIINPDRIILMLKNTI